MVICRNITVIILAARAAVLEGSTNLESGGRAGRVRLDRVSRIPLYLLLAVEGGPWRGRAGVGSPVPPAVRRWHVVGRVGRPHVPHVRGSWWRVLSVVHGPVARVVGRRALRRDEARGHVGRRTPVVHIRGPGVLRVRAGRVVVVVVVGVGRRKPLRGWHNSRSLRDDLSN